MRVSNEAKEILIGHLARVDAAWLPLRAQDWSAAGAIWHARQSPSGVTWGEKRGATDAEYKRAARAADQLADAGLIQRTTKQYSTTLTAAGERLARRLAGPCSLAEFTAALEWIRDRTAANDCTAAGFVPEVFVAGVGWGGDTTELRILATALIPAFRRGWVESASTVHGHVYYRIAAAEWPSDDAICGSASDDSEWRPEFADVYFDQIWQTRGRLRNQSSESELGFIPLGDRLIRSGRSESNLSGIDPLFPITAAAA